MLTRTYTREQYAAAFTTLVLASLILKRDSEGLIALPVKAVALTASILGFVCIFIPGRMTLVAILLPLLMCLASTIASFDGAAKCRKVRSNPPPLHTAHSRLIRARALSQVSPSDGICKLAFGFSSVQTSYSLLALLLVYKS